MVEAIERALQLGGGRVNVHAQSEADGPSETWRYSTDLHCPDSDLRYETPHPSMFSFNSALGACETCRGFGRVIGVDYGLVIPDERKTLRDGAIKPFQTPSCIESQDDLGSTRPRPASRATAVPRADRQSSATGSSTARRLEELEQELAGSGTASSASSGTSRARPTRCTSACCFPSTAATRRARRAWAPAEAGGAAVARRCARRRRRGDAAAGPVRALPARACVLVARAARSAARPVRCTT